MLGVKVAASLSLLFIAAPACVQDSKPSETLANRVDVVPVVFSVTDKSGSFVRNLQQANFKILDNNQPPKEILNFESQTDLPLRIGLLIDASNAIQDRFVVEQQGSSEFLKQTIRPANDKAFVLAFDEVPDTLQDFTDDKDKLAAGIKAIRPGGGTAMWDAVYYACRDKMMHERNSTPVRRAIVLISDGKDDQSRVLRQEAIEMALRAEVIVYAISTNLNDIQNGGDLNLQMLADQTGGRAFFPTRLSDLTHAFNQIQAELRSQYSVVYRPDNFQANGEFHSIAIFMDDRKLKVRARRGYFAPKR